MALVNVVTAAQLQAIEHPLRSLVMALFAVPVLYVLANEVIRRQARVAGLGGPSGLPLIGNLYQIRKNAAEKYRQWARTYGAVYQIQLGNIPVVVVNSAASAKILFGQNAQALSSRPEFYTFHKVRPLLVPTILVLVCTDAFRFYPTQPEQLLERLRTVTR
jgi:3-hydroxyphenylacetate 6-hydroxylase